MSRGRYCTSTERLRDNGDGVYGQVQIGFGCVSKRVLAMPSPSWEGCECNLTDTVTGCYSISGGEHQEPIISESDNEIDKIPSDEAINNERSDNYAYNVVAMAAGRCVICVFEYLDNAEVMDNRWDVNAACNNDHANIEIDQMGKTKPTLEQETVSFVSLIDTASCCDANMNGNMRRKVSALRFISFEDQILLVTTCNEANNMLCIWNMNSLLIMEIAPYLCDNINRHNDNTSDFSQCTTIDLLDKNVTSLTTFQIPQVRGSFILFGTSDGKCGEILIYNDHIASTNIVYAYEENMYVTLSGDSKVLAISITSVVNARSDTLVAAVVTSDGKLSLLQRLSLFEDTVFDEDKGLRRWSLCQTLEIVTNVNNLDKKLTNLSWHPEDPCILLIAIKEQCIPILMFRMLIGTDAMDSIFCTDLKQLNIFNDCRQFDLTNLTCARWCKRYEEHSNHTSSSDFTTDFSVLVGMATGRVHKLSLSTRDSNNNDVESYDYHLNEATLISSCKVLPILFALPLSNLSPSSKHQTMRSIVGCRDRSVYCISSTNDVNTKVWETYGLGGAAIDAKCMVKREGKSSKQILIVACLDSTIHYSELHGDATLSIVKQHCSVPPSKLLVTSPINETIAAETSIDENAISNTELIGAFPCCLSSSESGKGQENENFLVAGLSDGSLLHFHIESSLFKHCKSHQELSEPIVVLQQVSIQTQSEKAEAIITLDNAGNFHLWFESRRYLLNLVGVDSHKERDTGTEMAMNFDCIKTKDMSATETIVAVAWIHSGISFFKIECNEPKSSTEMLQFSLLMVSHMDSGCECVSMQWNINGQNNRCNGLQPVLAAGFVDGMVAFKQQNKDCINNYNTITQRCLIDECKVLGIAWLNQLEFSLLAISSALGSIEVWALLYCDEESGSNMKIISIANISIWQDSLITSICWSHYMIANSECIIVTLDSGVLYGLHLDGFISKIDNIASSGFDQMVIFLKLLEHSQQLEPGNSFCDRIARLKIVKLLQNESKRYPRMSACNIKIPKFWMRAVHLALERMKKIDTSSKIRYSRDFILSKRKTTTKRIIDLIIDNNIWDELMDLDISRSSSTVRMKPSKRNKPKGFYG